MILHLVKVFGGRLKSPPRGDSQSTPPSPSTPPTKDGNLEAADEPQPKRLRAGSITVAIDERKDDDDDDVADASWEFPDDYTAPLGSPLSAGDLQVLCIHPRGCFL